jgi:hypothetical protein
VLLTRQHRLLKAHTIGCCLSPRTVPLFQEASKDAAVANKQLRYGVRFIVVCLLLNRRDMVRRLVRQLRTLVEDYARNFQVSATHQTPCKSFASPTGLCSKLGGSWKV